MSYTVYFIYIVMYIYYISSLYVGMIAFSLQAPSVLSALHAALRALIDEDEAETEGDPKQKEL